MTVGDCNDEDASIYVGADDTWYDGIDSNCDGANDYDQDGDGVVFYRECDDTDELKRQKDESLSIIETTDEERVITLYDEYAIPFV